MPGPPPTLVGAFSVIVQPVVEPMDRFAALVDGDISLYVEVEAPETRAQDSVIRGNKLQLTYARSPWSLLARDFDIHDIYTH